MTCERQYTASAVAEMQQIALAVELRRHIAIRCASLSNVIRNGSSVDAAMAAAAIDSFEQVLAMLDRLAPVEPVK